MSQQHGTLASLGRHVVAALEPLRRAVNNADAFKALMLRLGWESAGLPPAYTALGNAIAEAVQAAQALPDEPNPEEIAALCVKTRAAYEQIKRINTAPPGVDASAFLAEIGERLFELLLTDYLAQEQPALFNLLAILNVIDEEDVPASTVKRGHGRTRFKWQEIPTIIREPMALPARVYGWGTPHLRFQLLAQHVGELLFALGFPVVIGQADALLAEGYRDEEDDDGAPENTWLVKVPFYYITIAGKNLEAAFTLMELPGGGSKLPGIIIQPEIPEEFPLHFHIAPEIDLRLRAGTNAPSAFGILIRPGEAAIKYPFAPGQAPPAAGIGVGFDFNLPAPVVLFGAPKATRLEFQGASVDFSAQTRAGELDILLSAQLKKFALVLAASDGDAFLRSFLGSGERRVEFPLGIEWSRQNGVHFAGSNAFEIALQPRQHLGPLALDEIALRLFAPADNAADISLAVGTALSGQLGPVAFSIAGMGFQIDAKFAEGNVGPFDLALGFKPPIGVGLAIDAGVVHGGGFLSCDPAKGEYVGTLFLELEGGIAVTALGLLNTRLPGGQPGYSLLVMLTAEGFAPIQLGFGFTLTGIGGLLGVNRTMMVDVLRSGLKTGMLNALLFPDDPVRNAPQLLSDLRAVFPPVPNRYVFGPLVQLAWGTPTLLTLELAVVLELPDPVRLVLLGRLQALLPEAAHALIQIRLDAIGLIDFNRGDVALDATLYDSRIGQFVLSGDMALRANWGAQPNFVLALGGFHPRFPAPAGFPQLARLALSLSDGVALQLRCEAYLALTSNTVQFGARLELHAAGGGFSFDGALGFDALVQLAPLAFVVDIGAALALRYRGHLLLGIFFTGSLAGPAPWQVEGKATIKLFFFKVSVHFEHRFGAAAPPPLPAPVDVLALVVDALRDERNWSATVPRGEPPVVALREPATTSAGLWVHPLAELTVRQRVVPLQRRITKVGSAPLAGGPTTCTVAAAGIGTTPVPIAATPVCEPFALAQYEELSDDAKLARPAFEPQEAGLQFGMDEVAYEYEARLDQAIAYETLLIDPTQPAALTPEEMPYVLPSPVLEAVVRLGAAGQAAFRRRGLARYRERELVA